MFFQQFSRKIIIPASSLLLLASGCQVCQIAPVSLMGQSESVTQPNVQIALVSDVNGKRSSQFSSRGGLNVRLQNNSRTAIVYNTGADNIISENETDPSADSGFSYVGSHDYMSPPLNSPSNAIVEMNGGGFPVTARPALTRNQQSRVSEMPSVAVKETILETETAVPLQRTALFYFRPYHAAVCEPTSNSVASEVSVVSYSFIYEMHSGMNMSIAAQVNVVPDPFELPDPFLSPTPVSSLAPVSSPAPVLSSDAVLSPKAVTDIVASEAASVFIPAPTPQVKVAPPKDEEPRGVSRLEYEPVVRRSPVPGRIESVDVEGEVAIIRLSESCTPSIHSRVHVVHKYSLGRLQSVGEFEVTNVVPGFVAIRPVAGTSLRQISVGDSATVF